MTAVVGLLCKNGVIIGTDGSATFSHGKVLTIEQRTKKLEIVGDSIILAGTGQVGLGQRFINIVKEAFENNVFQKRTIEICKELCKLTIDDFKYTYLNPGNYGALVAFVSEGNPQLCEFAVTDFQPELKTEKMWYVSMGSAQPIMDPFLALMRDVFWKEGCPSVRDGEFAVAWTLKHAIDVNPGGVNEPISIASISKSIDENYVVKLLDENDLGEHMDHIVHAKSILRKYGENLRSPNMSSVPDVPKVE